MLDMDIQLFLSRLAVVCLWASVLLSCVGFFMAYYGWVEFKKYWYMYGSMIASLLKAKQQGLGTPREYGENKEAAEKKYKEARAYIIASINSFVLALLALACWFVFKG